MILSVFSGGDKVVLNEKCLDVKRRNGRANSLYSKLNTVRYSRCVHKTFAEFFRELIGDRRGAQADFARKAKISYQLLNNLLRGDNGPNLKKKGQLERWADILELTSEQRAEFILLGHLYHSSDHVQGEVVRMHHWKERLTQENSELKRRLDALERDRLTQA